MNRLRQIIWREIMQGKGLEPICSRWEEYLKDRHPELFEEEFKVGDWLYVKPASRHEHISEGGLIRMIEDECNSDSHIYFQANCNVLAKRCRKATPKEIESHLIEEAKRRGLEFGNHICILAALGCGRNVKGGNIRKYKYDKEEDALWIYTSLNEYSANNIYRKGQWAETTISKEEAEKKLGLKIVD